MFGQSAKQQVEYWLMTIITIWLGKEQQNDLKNVQLLNGIQFLTTQKTKQKIMYNYSAKQ